MPLWLIYIDVLEVVILLVIYLIKYVPNKTEDLLNDYMINMITAINESKTLTRHIPCECKCKFYGMKCNSNQIWNNGKYQCECKNPKKHVCKRIIFGILVLMLVKMVNMQEALLSIQ